MELEESVARNDNDDDDYVMSYVVPCTPWLYFGPPPRTAQDVEYLRKVCKVTDIVNMRTDKSCFYKRHFEEQEEGAVNIIFLPTDTTQWPSVGRLKKDQLLNRARRYVDHARPVTLKKTRVLYIHDRSGEEEEAFIAFALWGLMATDPLPPPPVPSTWLREKQQFMVFRQDGEKLNMADVIMKEAQHMQRVQSMFHLKKKIRKG